LETLLSNPLFQSYGYLLASAFVALAVGLICSQFLALATYPRQQLGDSHPFERQRRDELRSGNAIYRWLEPLVDEISSLVGRAKSHALSELQRYLTVSREKLPWRPEEFLAVKWLEAAAAGGVLFLILWLAGWSTSAFVVGIGVAGIYGFLGPKFVRDRAQKRLSRIRTRLPFAVDLIALMMEAGGGFQECLQTTVIENGDHPLTDELSEVLRQISLGRPRQEALHALQQRLHDPDIDELVFAVNKGEELGTPLSAILRDQAEQMRLKRSQRGEKAAAEAQVNIVFPGMVVMIACLLVVIAPIVLPAVLQLL
jgi:tight adherence protein C